MGFQDHINIGARLRSPCRYERLSNRVEEIKVAAKQGRCFWVKRSSSNGLRHKGVRLSPRSRKITLKVLSMVVMTSKIVKMYNEAVNRLSIVDHSGVYPNFIFTSHWGLPVLSYSSAKYGNTRVLSRS